MRWLLPVCLLSCSPPRDKPRAAPAELPVVVQPDAAPDPAHNEPWSRAPRYEPTASEVPSEESGQGAHALPPVSGTYSRATHEDARSLRVKLEYRAGLPGDWYTLTITGDARVAFWGRRDGDGFPATQRGSMSFTQLAEMLEAFERVDFFARPTPKVVPCRAHYWNEIAITVTLRERTRTILHSYNCRDDKDPAVAHLPWLEQQIDRLAGGPRFRDGTAIEQATLYCNYFDHPRGCVQWSPPD